MLLSRKWLGVASVVGGAAPIGREVLEFFASLDIIVQEVYGQSEDTGPTSFNRRGKTKLGTVGPAIDGVKKKMYIQPGMEDIFTFVAENYQNENTIDACIIFRLNQK